MRKHIAIRCLVVFWVCRQLVGGTDEPANKDSSLQCARFGSGLPGPHSLEIHSPVRPGMVRENVVMHVNFTTTTMPPIDYRPFLKGL